jgi:hypothetical protein
VTALNFTRILSNGSSSSTLFLTGKRKKLDNVLIDQINRYAAYVCELYTVIITPTVLYDVVSLLLLRGSCSLLYIVLVVEILLYILFGYIYSNVEAS